MEGKDKTAGGQADLDVSVDSKAQGTPLTSIPHSQHAGTKVNSTEKPNAQNAPSSVMQQKQQAKPEVKLGVKPEVKPVKPNAPSGAQAQQTNGQLAANGQTQKPMHKPNGSAAKGTTAEPAEPAKPNEPSKPSTQQSGAKVQETAKPKAAKPTKKQTKAAEYGDDKIIHLDPLEHIRLRSGMYIGRLGDGSNSDDGIYVLLKEVIDNAVDEFIMGFGSRIEIQVQDGSVRVRDYGRGIPLGKVVECVSQINTGAKYNDDVFQFSVGMNGVGTKAVNALSSHFRVVSVREGKACEAVFTRGKLVREHTGDLNPTKPNGTYFEFTPDQEIFGNFTFNMEFVENRVWNYAYLNSGLTLVLNGQQIKSDGGLKDLLEKEIEDALYPVPRLKGAALEFAFTHTSSYGEAYFSFVNGQLTADGGTHLWAFKEGFVKGINDFFGTSYKAEDVREGLRAALLVKIKEPIFESQTKNKLGNTDVRQWIVPQTQAALDDWLRRNPEAARKIGEKIQASEKLRVELAAVKKEAKEAARKISIRIPKLKDCRFHVQDGAKGSQSMIFITEGDSASGTMTHSRNADYQAIFSLRGKPENMYGKKKSEIYKNDELYQLMMALGIEQETENLKYSKIVIATDADNDGFHIRNLVLTFFLGYFEELVTSGRVYILETPLFRVRNKKQTLYCYSEAERDAAQKQLGGSTETTRFKGLGEISPSEFHDFIAPDTIHLTPVEISQLKAVPKLLSFYMGKNTPERRSFIEKHLLASTDIDA